MSPWLLHQRTADTLKPLVSTPQWIWTVATALRGIAARKLRHIRPPGNFMLSGVLRGLHITDTIDIVVYHHHQFVTCVERWFPQHVGETDFPHKCGKDSFMLIVFKSLPQHSGETSPETSIIINHESMMCVFLYHDCLNQWMMNHRLSILYHFPLIATSELRLFRISGTVHMCVR